MKKVIPVQEIGIALIFNKNGELLIDQRLDEGLLGGMWEFPGGKQELGEKIEITIKRELKEELGIEIEVGDQLISFNHSYSHKNLRFVVLLCELISGEPQPLASQQVCWVKPESICEYPFPAANTRIIQSLIEYFKGTSCAIFPSF